MQPFLAAPIAMTSIENRFEVQVSAGIVWGMIYLAVMPSPVWIVVILFCLCVQVVRRPKGSAVHLIALVLAAGQSLVALSAVAFTTQYAIGDWACLTGYSGTRLLMMVLLGLLATLATFLLVDRQRTLAKIRLAPGFTLTFVALQFLTLGATYRSALLCTV